MSADKTVHFPGSRFTVDYQDYLSQYDVVCERPVLHGYDALLAGGGDLVAVAFTPDDTFRMVINKSDVLTQRPMQHNEWGDREDTHIPIHLGVLEVKGCERLFAAPDHFHFQQSVYDGKITLQVEKGDMALHIESWVSYGENILVLHIRPDNGCPRPFVLELSRTVNPCYGTNLSASMEEGSAYLHYCGFDGAEYALGMQSDTADLQVDQGKIRVLIPAEGACFFLAAATQSQAVDLRSHIRQRLLEFRKQSLSVAFAAHQKRWLAFWRKSFLHTSQHYLNNLWYLALYHMAIGSQGSYPIKFNGGLFNWRKNDYRRWGGGFWSLNQTRSYHGLFNTDHMELLDNIFQRISDYLPEARQNTRYHFDLDAIWFPEIFKPWTGSVSPSSATQGKPIAEMTYPEYRSVNVWIRSAAAHYGILFWRRWKMTGDLQFLDNYAFPLLKGTADFYAGCVEKEEDDLYHMPLSMASECPPAGKDAVSDLSCMRWLFPAVIEAAEALHMPLPEKARYTDILDHLAPYPEWDGGYTHINYKGRPFSLRDTTVDWNGEPVQVQKYFLWHAPQNYPVFPWGVSGSDSADYQKAYKTYWRERFNMDWCCGDHAMPAARLGLRDETYRQLHRIICSFQKLKQGLFSEHHDVQFVNDGQKEQFQQAYLNASGAFTGMVNESCLQGHRGFIEIFPAFPNEWSGSFALLCEGGFFVCGETVEGAVVQYFSVHSRLGGPCTVKNPWPRHPEMVAEGNQDLIDYEYDEEGQLIRFMTEVGKTYIFTPPGRTECITRKYTAELKACPKMLGISVLGQGINNTHQHTWSVW